MSSSIGIDRYVLHGSSDAKPNAIPSGSDLKHNRMVYNRKTLRFTEGVSPSGYANGGRINVKVKSNEGWIIPSSGRLRFSLFVTNTAGSAPTFTDGVHAIFDEAHLKVGGNDLHRIEYVNRLVGALQSQVQSADFRATTGTFGMGIGKTQAINTSAVYEIPLSLWFGFNQLQKLFPLRFIQNGLEMTFVLGPANTGVKTAGAANCTITLSNVEVLFDVVQLAPSVDMALQTVLQGSEKKLVYPVNNWQVERRSMNEGVAPINVSFVKNAPYLKGALFFHRPIEDVAQQSYFERYDALGVSNVKLTMDGKTIAGQEGDLSDALACYNHSKLSFGQYSDLQQASGYATRALYEVSESKTYAAAAGDVAEVAATQALFSLYHSFEALPETEDLLDSIDNSNGSALFYTTSSVTIPEGGEYIYGCLEYTSMISINAGMITIYG